MALAEVAAAAGRVCAHCGLPAPAAGPGSEPAFCCAGCAAAWAILHDAGLESYYRFSERRAAPVVSSERSFEEFDHPAFHALYVRGRPGGVAETELYLEGVHCGSCVWLVERVPLLVEGLARAELDLRRSLVHLVWDPASAPLSAIARALDRLGYRPHPFRGMRLEAARRSEDRDLLVRIGVAGAIAANTMLAALALYSGWFSGMEQEMRRYFRWLSLALVTPAMLWPARVFFRGAWGALRARALHMDVPIAIALAAGYARGVANTVTGRGPIYFDGVAMLVFLLLGGRYLQQRAQRAARDSAELLHSLTPSTARLVGPGGIREVPSESLLPGMEVEVRPGETLPADGVVVEGRSTLDLALLSGESRPVAIGPDERAWAGTVNRVAPLRLRVERVGEDTRLGRILEEVERGAARRAPVVALADRLAAGFIAVTLGLAAITAALWWRHDASFAVDQAIALLVVTCPCALALATPLAVTVAVGRAARAGILVKSGQALEALARPAVMVLDKTGTLTAGRTTLVAWEGAEDVKPLVLALEAASTHPLAAGFREAWSGVEAPTATEVSHVIGGGVEGIVDGRRVIAGSPAFVRSRTGYAPPGNEDGVGTPVLVAVDGLVVGRATFADAIRPGARQTLDRLRAGFDLRLLSGDHPAVAAEVGRRLGFANGAWEGAASPEIKLRRIEDLARQGSVIMVGDGINDAAAIARATVGVGVRGGAEACLAAADVFLARPGLEPLVALTDGARHTLGVIRRNLAFSIAYNVVGAGLAMAGMINPLIAAILMPASSFTVVLASWRSRTFEEAP